jgi:hypothetical protein
LAGDSEFKSRNTHVSESDANKIGHQPTSTQTTTASNNTKGHKHKGPHTRDDGCIDVNRNNKKNALKRNKGHLIDKRR